MGCFSSIPALLTRMSTPPYCSTAVAIETLYVALDGRIGANQNRVSAVAQNRLDETLRLSMVFVGMIIDDDVGAGSCKAPRDRIADSGCRARNDGRATGQVDALGRRLTCNCCFSGQRFSVEV